MSEPLQEGPFASRLSRNVGAKGKIAHLAAQLLKPRDSLFIDTGTTTLHLADQLVDLPGLVIITNSLKIAARLGGNPEHQIFLAGGAYSSDAGECLGHCAVDQIRRFRARHAFLTVGAIDENYVMDFDPQEAEVAQTMIERAESVTVLADSSRFDKTGVFEVAQWSAIDTLVTDTLPAPRLAAAIHAAGTRIVTGEDA